MTVYAPLEQHIVAHCQGHSSWVTGVAWDASRSEERTLRIASVGEDCKLILWDLSSASLTRPKAHVSRGVSLAAGAGALNSADGTLGCPRSGSSARSSPFDRLADVSESASDERSGPRRC